MSEQIPSPTHGTSSENQGPKRLGILSFALSMGGILALLLGFTSGGDYGAIKASWGWVIVLGLGGFVTGLIGISKNRKTKGVGLGLSIAAVAVSGGAFFLVLALALITAAMGAVIFGGIGLLQQIFSPQ